MSTLGALFSCPLFPDLTGVSSIIKAGDFNHYATVPRQRRKKNHMYTSKLKQMCKDLKDKFSWHLVAFDIF